MKLLKLFFAPLVLFISLAVPFAAFASTTTNAVFHGTITITNNSTAASGVVVSFTANTSQMIGQGMMLSTLVDTAITAGGSDVAYMPQPSSGNWWVYVPTIGASTTVTNDLYTGGATSMNSKLKYSPGTAGMTVADNNTSLEPGSSNFVTAYSGYVYTTAGGSPFLLKDGAISISPNASTSGTINAKIYSTANLTPSGPGDLTNISSVAGAATHWQAVLTNDGATSYVQQGLTSEATDTYAQTPSVSLPTNSIIDYVTVSVVGATPTGGGGLYVVVRLGGTSVETSLGDMTSSYVTYSANLTRPGGGSWVYADISTLQIGAHLTGGTGTPRATMVYGTVGYHALASAASIENGEHVLTIGNTGLNFVRASSQYASVPQSIDFDMGNGSTDVPYTIIAMVNPADTTVGTIAGRSKSGAAAWQFVPETGGYLAIYLQDVSLGTIARKTTAAIPLNQWTQVAFTYDGSKAATGLIMYMNGAVSASNSVADATYAGVKVTSQVMNIGASTSPSQYFNGSIADIKIYKGKALSATEILADYNGTSSTTNLVAWYKLNEGTGLPQDSSGNGHHATTNTATWAGNFLSLAVDGIRKAFAVGVSVPDTGSSWVLAPSNSTAYMSSANITIDGALKGSWAYQYNDKFYDASGNGNTATPSFPTVSSNAYVSATLSNLLPVNEAKVTSYSISQTGTILSANTTMPSLMWTDLNFARLFGVGPAVTSILGVSGTPEAAWWMPFIFIFIVLVGFLVYHATTGARSLTETTGYKGSTATMAGVIEAALILLAVVGPLPLWPAFIFPIDAGAIILSEKHYGWG